MRYLTVAADYTRSALRDDFDGPLEPESLGLPSELCADLGAWNDQYRQVIPLSEEARHRADIAELIRRLDDQGQALVRRVADTLKLEAKVRYYSEGHLRYLMPDANPLSPT